VNVWGGTKPYKYPDGLEIQTYTITSPVGSVEAQQKALDLLQVYADMLKPDALVGFWDSFAL